MSSRLSSEMRARENEYEWLKRTNDWKEGAVDDGQGARMKEAHGELVLLAYTASLKESIRS